MQKGTTKQRPLFLMSGTLQGAHQKPLESILQTAADISLPTILKRVFVRFSNCTTVFPERNSARVYRSTLTGFYISNLHTQNSGAAAERKRNRRTQKGIFGEVQGNIGCRSGRALQGQILRLKGKFDSLTAAVLYCQKIGNYCIDNITSPTLV